MEESRNRELASTLTDSSSLPAGAFAFILNESLIEILGLCFSEAPDSICCIIKAACGIRNPALFALFTTNNK